ncbi:MAG TPA: sterol desaturase family protein [Rhodanobacter sp.]|nr:sterol desaturase family protein [Rhodanobacter sp.]
MKRTLLRGFLDSVARMSTTRTNYWAEFVIDLALGTWLLFEGWQHRQGGDLTSLLAILLGLFAFSFVEYFFHRWMFHTRIPLFAQGHGMHHERPLGYDSLPFFLPGAVLLILTGLCMLVASSGFALLMMGSVTFGYIAYGLSHFIIHHVRFRHPLLLRWAGAHHVHHYHPDTNFGVTTPLWDIVLGTQYVRKSRKP